MWTGLGVLGVGLGRRFARTTLRVHGALYLAAAALATGLVVAGAAALVGLPARELAGVAWVAGAGAALAWALLAGERGPTAPAGARFPRLLLALVSVLSLTAAVQSGLASVLGARLAADPGAQAVARSAVLVGLVLGLAWLVSRGMPELVFLVYALVAVGGLKLVLQDVREGRPATLVLSLALYGALLILLPRLLRTRERTGG